MVGKEFKLYKTLCDDNGVRYLKRKTFIVRGNDYGIELLTEELNNQEGGWTQKGHGHYGEDDNARNYWKSLVKAGYTRNPQST
jgi:hypothetical protein